MKPNHRVTVNLTNRTIIRAILWVAAAYFVYRFIGRVSHVLTLIFVAAFLALALNPVVTGVSRQLHVKSRVRATAVAYLMVVGLLAIFLALIIPPLVTQTRQFIKDVPRTVENFQTQDTGLARTARRYHIDQKLTEGAKNFTSHYGNFGTTVLATGKRIAEVIASVVAVLVLTFMMLVEGPKWLELYAGILPEPKRVLYKRVGYRVYRAVTGFVNGQVILAAIAGFFAFATLEIASHILNVHVNALALAGIVSVFGIIPLFGNPLAAVLVILVSLLSSATLALVMAIYFVLYFFIENHTLQPYLQSKLNELTALMVFVAALIGVSFGGILGAIAAIPAASTIKILLEEHFKHRQHRQPAIEKERL